MMKDLISRQDAIDALDEIESEVADGYGFQYEKWRKHFTDLPSAQPERKKGKWIYKKDLKQFFCSECGFPSLTHDDVYIYSMDLPNYCEDCGADMRVERRPDECID